MRSARWRRVSAWPLAAALAGFDHFRLIEKIFGLFTVIFAAAGVFFAVCYLLRFEEMQEAVGLVTRKLRRRVEGRRMEGMKAEEESRSMTSRSHFAFCLLRLLPFHPSCLRCPCPAAGVGVGFAMFTPPAIYADPAFEMAVEQFRLIADHLNIDRNDRDRLLLPKRSVTVSLPIHRDDGSTTVFTGYRVQHHLTMGPTKGGTRFAPSVNLGEVAALSIWMSWKCALAGLPYGGAKGGITVSPRDLSHRELEALSRRYMQEMIPFVGPHTDIMGPDMGTNEQVMAWFMDTYSVHMGHTVSEIVTGKPVFLGGSAGRRESTGRGVAFLVERALDTLKIEPGGCTAIVQGYGNVGAVAAESTLFQIRRQDRRHFGRVRGVLRPEGHRPARPSASTCAKTPI